MKDSNDKPSDSSTPFQRFDQFARRLMAVPKAKIDAAEKKYQQRKAAKKRGK
jgi:hypothetical protein